MNHSELKKLCAAVRGAAKPIKMTFRKPVESQIKADGTPVTSTDLEVHNTLLRWANQNGLGYIGEEGCSWSGQGYRVLYVDPLDGTGAFQRGLPTVTTLATVMERRRDRWYPVAAVIYDPIANHMWWAAERNLTRQRFVRPGHPEYIGPCRVRKPERPYRVTAVAWRNAPHNLELIKARILRQPLLDHQSFGSTGLGAGLSASGHMDAILTGSNSAVEAAAMTLIVRGAGGVATDLGGQDLTGFELQETDGMYDFRLPGGALFSAHRDLTEFLVTVVG